MPFLVIWHKLFHGHPKGLCELFDIENRDVSVSALNTTHICPVKTRKFSKFLLGNAHAFSDSAKFFSKSLKYTRQRTPRKKSLSGQEFACVEFRACIL